MERGLVIKRLFKGAVLLAPRTILREKLLEVLIVVINLTVSC